jgi:hypothetical protein
MSTTANNRGISGGNGDPGAGKRFLDEAVGITHRHLEMVADEIGALFVERLSGLWLSEKILDRAEALAMPRELIAHLRKHYSLDKVQALCAFFLDFFSGGLAGDADGSLSFTHLEFDGLQHFYQKFGHRLPSADRHRLHELIDALKKAD